MNFDKSVSQSKKPAFDAWQKLKPEVKEKLIDYLEADLKQRIKKARKGDWVPMFPDCFRWIKNGQYEQFKELATNKKDVIVNKRPTKDKSSELPF